MNIRYTIAALLLGSQVSLAEQPIAAESAGNTTPLTGSHADLPTTSIPTLDISDSLTEKLNRQLEESTANQPLPKAQWVSANVSPGR